MTITDEMRLAVADMFKFAHRNSCYPDAMQFEAEAFADGILSAIAPAIRKAALEEAAKLADAEAVSWRDSLVASANWRSDTAQDVACDIRTLADKEGT